MTRILLADDHSVVRYGLRHLLSLDPELTVVAEARDAWETIARVREGGLDLLLLDMSMPGPSGIDLIRRVKAEDARIPVLVLSMHADRQIAARAIQAGANGYLTKDSEPEVLFEAIRQVSRGANFIDQARQCEAGLKHFSFESKGVATQGPNSEYANDKNPDRG